MPWHPCMRGLRTPWPRTLPRARGSVHQPGSRQPLLSHAMMAAKGDDADPARARSIEQGDRGQPSRGQGARPGGRPGTRRARRRPGGACPRRGPACPPGGAIPPEALTAALCRRVAQRAARDHSAHPPLVGYLCERCLDAPALVVQPAPWGGEMGVCAACQETLAAAAEPHAKESSEAPPSVG
jgi:hypothetical protein